jgi:hypothetical protein
MSQQARNRATPDRVGRGVRLTACRVSGHVAPGASTAAIADARECAVENNRFMVNRRHRPFDFAGGLWLQAALSGKRIEEEEWRPLSSG